MTSSRSAEPPLLPRRIQYPARSSVSLRPCTASAKTPWVDVGNDDRDDASRRRCEAARIRLGTYPSRSIAASMACRVSDETLSGLRRARETVISATPAASATSFMLACLPASLERRRGPGRFTIIRSLSPVQYRRYAIIDSAATVGETCAAQREPTQVCAGIVGNTDLRRGERVQDVIDEMAVAARGRFRGIPQITARHPGPAVKGTVATPPPGLLVDTDFRAGAKVLTRTACPSIMGSPYPSLWNCMTLPAPFRT